ncbi:MAG: bacteriohemerythrin [Defluviitaleaceae bacterium]|nr:bacteriohemerythrin [Defluviitaleaceae bacterium]MCL2239621.1 bacteriohemerythrin [Defluviitaleaceae bacterium]
MEWSPKYLTGNALVDSEHEQIFAMVTDVIGQKFKERGEKIETVINFFVSYTLQHFSHELKLMEDSGYPEIQEHKRQHAEYMEKVNALKAKIETDPNRDISVEVGDVIADWLENHVLCSDKKMALHYRDWMKEVGNEDGFGATILMGL